MSRKIRRPYVSRAVRDAEILWAQRAREGRRVTTPPPVNGLKTAEQAHTILQEMAAVETIINKPVDLDGDLRKFGELIERRYLEATQHMENVVADARRIVFRSKER